jgi:hypothetical protein
METTEEVLILPEDVHEAVDWVFRTVLYKTDIKQYIDENRPPPPPSAGAEGK